MRAIFSKIYGSFRYLERYTVYLLTALVVILVVLLNIMIYSVSIVKKPVAYGYVQGYDEVLLKMNPVDKKVKGFEIHRKQLGQENYEIISTLEKQEQNIFSELIYDGQAVYKVRSFFDLFGRTIYSKFTEDVTITLPRIPPIGNLTTKVSNQSVTLSWKTLENVKTYDVYRSTEKNGTYEKVATVKDNKYIDKNLEVRNYYYKVKSIVGDGETKFRVSDDSNVYTVSVSKPEPQTSSENPSTSSGSKKTTPQFDRTLVYIVNYATGIYHKFNCSLIRSWIRFPIMKGNAAASGLKPCKVCKP
jgi:hypothetical protein